MFYKNSVCDGCGKELLEDEDVVVCPECGTPQHRDCYKKNNGCVNARLHGGDFAWRPPEPEQPLEEPEKAGAQYGAPAAPVYGAEAVEAAFLRNVEADPETEIDGVTVREAALYIQNGAARYIKRLLRSTGKKRFVSWNWGAFFFSSCWFFFRKMYKAGFAFLGVILALNIAVTAVLNEKMSPFMGEVSEISQQMYELLSSDDTSEAAQKEMEQLAQRSKAVSAEILPYTTAYFAVVFLLPGIAAALLADSFYKKRMLSDISFARKAADDKKIFKFSIIRRGGVSFLAAFAAMSAQLYLPDMIFNAINYFIH